MGKIVRHEFLGSYFLVILLCITGVGIPVAFIYVFLSSVRVEEEFENPSAFLEHYKTHRA